MADVNRLKKKAAEYEAKRQFERAIGAYEQIVAALGSKVREADVPIFNRLGDLYFRVGQPQSGTAMHEKAVDLYAELGFFNNAIALCNKILRQEPDRASVYYKLGKISAKKGFISDAKQNFLEYSSRMRKSGQMDEAFRALKEFADLCPDQDDVRLSLAEQLIRAEKPAEALEQLQLLHQQLRAEGRETEATATVERMRAIDPGVVPREPNGVSASGRGDLIFLDLEEVAEGAKQTVKVDGFEPTALEGEAGPMRLLTPKEFGAARLPTPAAPEREFRSASSYLEGLPVLDDYEPTEVPQRSATPQGEEATGVVDDETSSPTGEEVAGLIPESAAGVAEGETAGVAPEEPLAAAELAESDTGQAAGSGTEPPVIDDAVAGAFRFSDFYGGFAGYEPGDSGFPTIPESVAGEAPVEDTAPAEPEIAESETEQGFTEPEPESEFVAEASSELPASAGSPEAASPRARPDDELVDLGEWLREIEGPRTTRMVTEEGEIPPEGEQADFEEMLAKFKQGIAENMDADDHGSHYDLGIAFREMGLLDEAIAQFQRALRGRENRVATYEALGQCFVDLRQYEVAATVLQRALREPGFEDDRGLGVLYLLGLANERMSRPGEAARYYQRVFSVDINFRDITDRRNAVAKAGG